MDLYIMWEHGETADSMSIRQKPHASPSDPDIAGDPTLTPIYMDIPIPRQCQVRLK